MGRRIRLGRLEKQFRAKHPPGACPHAPPVMRGVREGRWVDGIRPCPVCGLYPLLLGVVADEQEAALRLMAADGLAVDWAEFVLLVGLDYDRL